MSNIKTNLKILVFNKQGDSASNGFVGYTKKQINNWLKNNWYNPQNLSATVTDYQDNIVGIKPMGRKTIIWRI